MSSKLATRRKFLLDCMKMSGAFAVSGPFLEMFLANFFRATANSAFAAPGDLESYYLHLTFPGAPPKWLFDLPLTPNGPADGFVAGEFGSAFTGSGSSVGLEYRTYRHTENGKNFYLPPVWNMGLANQDFRSLLANTVMIRGLNTEQNNHQVSNGKQVAPIANGKSISGAVADNSRLPITSILDMETFAARAFKSGSGISGVNITYAETETANPVSTLLAPFAALSDGRYLASDVRALTDRTLEQFELYAKASGIGPTALAKAYDQALTLVDQNIIALGVDWAPVVNKYRLILSEALHPEKGSLPGLFDKQINTTLAKGTAKSVYSIDEAGDTNLYVERTDLRDIMSPTCSIPRLAENFAIAEILLGQVTSSITIGAGPLTNIEYAPGKFTTLPNDQHHTGSFTSTLATTLYYRAVLGCLTELVKSYTTRGIFDRTVIHIASDFNRNPVVGGSDHGFTGSNATLISGLIKKFQIVGNILKTSSFNDSPNTWGDAAPIEIDQLNRPFLVNDVVKTISAMLGVAEVTQNGRSILYPDGSGGWVLRKVEAKNV